MPTDTTDSSFWKSYRRRLDRIRDSELLGRSRSPLSRSLWKGRGRVGRAPNKPSEQPLELETPGQPSVPEFPFFLSDAESPSIRISPGGATGRSATLGGERYQLLGEELGRGSMGKVVLAYDRVLMRNVALKVPLPELTAEAGAIAALKAESRLTAGLEHPNIVPIYDLISNQEGVYGYVMRRVHGERLSEILRGLERGEAPRQEAYGRVRLLTIFSQIVTAVAYAHDSRIIHRDLKPNNIMVGPYGEVLLLDWGLARSLAHEDAGFPVKGASSFVGAPPYISPEQLAGDPRRMDERSDVYSLGAILYELLTYTPPFIRERYEDDDALLERIRTGQIEPPSQRAPERNIPPTLEEICMKCLERNPSDRYQSAMEIHRDVALFLEGTREQEWRRRAAEARLRDAVQAAERYAALRDEATRCQQEADVARRTVNAWDPVERKREVWNLQALAAQADESAMVTFTEAEKAFHQALGHDAGCRPAMDGLAELYWRRFLQAEAGRDPGAMRYFETRVRTFDARGRYAIRLKGDGKLLLDTDPGGGTVTVYAYREVDRVLRPLTPRELGRAPVRLTLPVGSYLARIRRRGYREVLYPFSIGRLETVEAQIRLYTEEEIGPGFCYVPGGFSKLGGDPEAFSSEMQVRYLDDFAIGRLPVTAAEYLAFINDLVQADPEEARRRVPREHNRPSPKWPRGPDGRYRLPEEQDEDGDRWLPDFPIFLVSWDDAVAYAAWKGAQDGRAYRLPTGEEWEKAARGADGRFFPWGDVFEPTYCKNRDARPGRPFPEPVALYPQDVSPYGVQDLAGGVSDWTSDYFGASRELRIARGGNWTVHERSCRLARLLTFRQEGTNVSVGFRLCFSLTRSW